MANATGDSLTFVDPKTADVQRVIKGIADPYHLRFSPDMKWFVTAANRLNHIDIYSWNGTEPKLVKRMLAAVGNRVEGLHRSQIGHFPLPADMAPGEWRWLQAEDLALLR